MCLECAICWELLCDGPCVSIDCGHIFHQKCVDGILENLQAAMRAQCPCCRNTMGTLRKLYINDEICTQGVEYKRMKRQMRESTAKQTNQDQIIESMETEYKELRRKYRKLKADEKEWRKEVAQMEPENYELPRKTPSAAKALKAKAVASTKTSPTKLVQYEQNGDTESKRKVAELQKKLRDEREKHRCVTNELKQKIKLLKSEHRETLEPEYTAKIEIQSHRRSMPVRECRKRVGNYRD